MSATNEARIEITAGTGRLPAALRSAMKMVQGFVGATTGLFKPMSKAMEERPDRRSLGVGSFVGNLGANLAMRGLDKLIDQGKEVMDFNEQLTRFGVDLRKTPGQMAAIGQAVREVSTQTGLGALEVLKAGRAYADMAGAESVTMDKISLIARAAQASGAPVEDMAKLMFTLTENMKVPPSELEDTIGGLINQAKDGSIHFKELAAELIALAPVYRQFGTTGRAGMIQLGAQMQLAGRGFGTASEAGTGLLRMYRALPQHAKLFEKGGVQIFKKGSRNELLTFEQIFDNIKKSTLALDRPALIKAMGRGEAERFFQLIKDMTKEYGELKEAGQKNGVVVADLATITESSSGRMAIAIEKIKNKFADALTPERIDQIVGGFERIADSVGPVLSVVGKLGGALAAVVDAGRWVGNTFRRDKQGLSDEDYDFFIQHRLTGGTNTKEENARMKRLGEYSNTVDQLQSLEEDHKPSDESIAYAVRVVRADMNPEDRTKPVTLGELKPTSQAAQAAASYLQESGAGSLRFAEADKREMARIQAEQSAEEKASVTKAIETGIGNKSVATRQDSPAYRAPYDIAAGGLLGLQGNSSRAPKPEDALTRYVFASELEKLGQSIVKGFKDAADAVTPAGHFGGSRRGP